MGQNLHRKDAWRKGAEELGTANSTYNDEQAVWSFNILDMEILVGLGEDPEAIAEEIISGFKESVAQKLPAIFHELIDISVQTDGNSLTLIVRIRHDRVDDEGFASLVDSLTELLMDYFG